MTTLNSVRDACKLDPDKRTEEHVNDIVEFVKDVKFFTKLTGLQQRALCRTMTHEVFGPREYIFHLDEIGDKFYIILAGSVSVLIPSGTDCPTGIHQNHCDCPNRPLETATHLEPGMGFGELALQSDQPRSATIQTREITETLVTKRADYEQYAGQLHRQFIEQRVKFLRQFPRIEDALQRCLVSTQDIAAMANCLNETGFSGNEMVVRQGDIVESMIFVRRGQLAMVRLIDLDNPCEANGEPCDIVPEHLRRPTRGEAGEAAAGGAAEAMLPCTSEASIGPTGSKGGAGAVQDHATWALTLANMMLEEKRRLAQEPPPWPPDPASRPGRSPGVAAFLAGRREQQAQSKEPAGTAPAEGTARGQRSSKRAPDRARGSFFARQDAEAGNRAQRAWRRLRIAWKTACIINRLKPIDGKWVPDQSGPGDQDTGMQHVAQMLDVSAARKKYAEYRSRELSHKRASRKKASIASARASAGDARSGRLVPSVSSRRRLLRIGTVGAFQYFGDRQVINGEAYPVSLVSDPVAEIYLMSKHDIQRRLPKKLFAALFMPDKDDVPSDVNVLEMHRQSERWNAFRRSLHGAAALARAPGATAPHRVQGRASAFGRNAGAWRSDPAANLDFLGVGPEGAHEALAPPRQGAVTLRGHDEVLFSQASAAFLRKFEFLRRDPELRRGLLRDGSARRHPLLVCGAVDEDADRDPSAFRFERNWAKLGKFSVGLDPLQEAAPAVSRMPQPPPAARQLAGPPSGDASPSASRDNAGSPVVSLQTQQQLSGRPPVSRGSAQPGTPLPADKGGGLFGGASTMTCSTELPPLSSARSLAVSTHTVSSSVVGVESARGSRRRPGPLGMTA